MSSYDAGRELLAKRAAAAPAGPVSYETHEGLGVVGGIVAGFLGLLAWSGIRAAGGRLVAARRHAKRRPLLYDAHGRALK